MFYKVWHSGCPIESGCNGNPTLATEQELDILRISFDDWNVDDNGCITSSGTANWKIEGKTFHAAPIVESEAALSVEDRLSVKPENFAPKYILKVEANWDAIPEQVKNDPMQLADYENLQGKEFPGEEVLNFVQSAYVTNLVISPDKSVSGYDHYSETQYVFTPVR